MSDSELLECVQSIYDYLTCDWTKTIEYGMIMDTILHKHGHNQFSLTRELWDENKLYPTDISRFYLNVLRDLKLKLLL